MKVFEYARDINLKSNDIIEKLTEYGYEVKNHNSKVTDEMKSKLDNHFKKMSKFDKFLS